MPSEQLPWDRRDFRKHERYGSDPRFGGAGFGSGGANSRWRDQHNSHAPLPPSPQPPPYHHHHNPHQPQRWYSDFRSSRPTPNGHGKQGGWHMYPDEGGHGFPPFGSRHNYRGGLEDDNFRSSGFREDGRCIRNGKESSRGGFSQKDWRSPGSETNPTSTNSLEKSTVEVNNQNSVENTPISHSNQSKAADLAGSISDLPSVSYLSASKEKQEDDGAADGATRLNHKLDKENILGSSDWKPLKWSRSGSLSSRGSTFSHCANSKGVGVNRNDIVGDSNLKSTVQDEAAPAPAPAPAPAAAAAAADGGGGGCIASVPRSTVDDSSSRKKPRLGWGEGLAKYEKKKVEGPEDGSGKLGSSLLDTSDAETMQPPGIDQLEKSPVFEPSSLVSGASTGFEEKQSIEAVNGDKIYADIKSPRSMTSRVDSSETNFNLGNSLDDLSSIAKLSCLVNELVQSDGQFLDENVKSVSLSNLLAWKVDVLKAIEVIESEVDSLETKYKSLSVEPGSFCSPPPFSESSLRECNYPSSETVKAPDFEVEPDLLNVVEAGDVSLDETDSLCSTSPKSVDSLSFGVPRDMESTYESIISSNKVTWTVTLEELSQLLPSGQRFFDLSTPSHGSSSTTDLTAVGKNFLRKRRALRFNERSLILKYKACKHFWKEGRVVSVRKLRGKSQKRFDQSQALHKKNRSCRSRLTHSGGTDNPPLTVPAEELVDFVNRLLSSSPFKPYRRILRMPALIIDRQTKESRFVSSNGLVEDPLALEKERYLINTWTSSEREVFIDKLASFGKDFRKISSFLDHKTVADCVEFYYKNHKSECFSRAKRKSGSSEQRKSQPSSTYLVTAGKRWSREAGAVSLDILGEASAIAASNDGYVESQPKYKSRMFFPSSRYYDSPRGGGDDGRLLAPESIDVYNGETAAVDVLAGICGSLSSEAMSSCITSSIDPQDGGILDLRLQRVNSCVKRPLTPPDVTQIVDKECSEESCEAVNSAHWTDDEKSAFVRAVSMYGKDFSMISRCVRTRSKKQCKVFFSKARKCLGLDLVRNAARSGVVSGDTNGDGNDDSEGAADLKPGRNPSESAENRAALDSEEVRICGENRAAEDFVVGEIVSSKVGSGSSAPLESSEIESASAEEQQQQRGKDNDDVGTAFREEVSRDIRAVSDGMIVPPEEEHHQPADDDDDKPEASGNCNGNAPSVLFPVPIKYQRSTSFGSIISYPNFGSGGGPVSHRKKERHPAEEPSPRILKGYPVSLSTLKEMNRDFVRVRLEGGGGGGGGGDPTKKIVPPLQRCSSSSNAEDDDRRPSGNGDVKLFGKILVSSERKNPPLQQQPNGVLGNESIGRTRSIATTDVNRQHRDLLFSEVHKQLMGVSDPVEMRYSKAAALSSSSTDRGGEGDGGCVGL